MNEKTKRERERKERGGGRIKKGVNNEKDQKRGRIKREEDFKPNKPKVHLEKNPLSK